MVSAAAAVATALVFGVLASTWQAVRATRAEQEQRRLREEAVRAGRSEAVQRLLAVEAKTMAEQHQYSASIALAQNLIELRDCERARRTLAQQSLAPLRGWEWGWLARTCHPDLMTLSPGREPLTGVAFSPDGRWLAAGSYDGTAKVWDLGSLAARPPLRGHSRLIALLGFSPDSRRLATASHDSTAKVWDVASGQLLFTLLGHSDWVYGAVFSPDGKSIATGSKDKTVRLWKAENGASLGVIGDYGDSIMCVAFSPDGRRLAYAGGSGFTTIRSSDTTVRILDLATRESRVLTGHTACVPCVAFSPDGTRVATASWDMTARLGDVRTDTQLRPFHHGRGRGGLFSVAFSPDGRLCAVAGGALDPHDLRPDEGVHLIDLATGDEVGVLEGHSRAIRGLAFNPGGTRLATTSFDGTVKIWPVPPPPEFLSLEGHDHAVWTVAVSPNGQYVGSGSLDQTAKIWHLETGRLLATLPVNFPVVSLAFSPDSSRLVTVAGHATAKVWDLTLERGPATPLPSNAEPVLVLSGHSNTVLCVAHSPSGRSIATGSRDKTARIWEAHSGRLLQVLEGHANSVLSVAFSPDGKRVGTASTDHTTRVWEAASGRLLFPLEGHQGPVLQVAWSPDGKRIATAGQDTTARFWDAETGAPLLPPLEGHYDGVSSLAFSPDGRRLATAGGGTELGKSYNLDWSVNLWDVATGQNLLRFEPHPNVIRAVAFSPDGARLVTGSLDNTVRVRSAFAWRSTDYPGDSTCSPQDRLERYKSQYWSQLLAARAGLTSAGRGSAPGTGRRMEVRQLGEFSVPVSRRERTRPLRPIPPRATNAGPDQVDLSPCYNAALNETWRPVSSLDDLDLDLSALAAGLSRLAGVLVDLRGVVQLGWSDLSWPLFPKSVRIPVSRRFRQFHVIQGAMHSEREDTLIGSYRLRYADGQEHSLEIRYGPDVRNWRVNSDPKPPGPSSEVAWTGPRSVVAPAGDTVRLFKRTYANPRPEVPVVHLDFVAEETRSAPFLVAVTVE